MRRIALVGRPYPDTDPAYRGLDRTPALVDESLGLTHPLNRKLLEFIAAPDPGRHTLHLGLDVKKEHLRIGRTLDVLEVLNPGEPPAFANEFLGSDVVFEGGDHSLLAEVLLVRQADNGGRSNRMNALQVEFGSGLNAAKLFPNAASARRFVDAALALGPWEGTEITWEVVDVWVVSFGVNDSGRTTA